MGNIYRTGCVPALAQERITTSYKTWGTSVCRQEMEKGVRFAVWAPNAKTSVWVIGEFNGWDETATRDGATWSRRVSACYEAVRSRMSNGR
ncbi:MAG: hypothetical protein ACLUD0_06940 [Eubacterium ramulus]